MKPTIGRIVIYNTTEEDRKLMYDHVQCNEQLQLPAIITAVWSETLVNVKVMTDGNLSHLWVTSIEQGDSARQWNWPKIEK